MDGEKMAITKIVISLMLTTTTWVYGDNKGIEGDWRLILTELGQSFIINISKTPDGTLVAATLGGIPLDKVTFDKGKLRFEGGSPLYIFEGTIKEDGLTIGGELQQGDQQWSALLKRVERVPIEAEDQSDSGIGQGVPAEGSGKPPAAEAQTTGESTGNRVLSLDGKTGCMRIADSQSLRSFSNAITIEVWVKASLFYADNWAISSIIRKNVASGAENFLLRFRNIDGSLCVQMGLGEIGTLRARREFDVNKWYHLAGTYDGSAITVLVNGVTVENGKFSGPLHIDKSDLFIGKGDPGYLYGECFHGELDEIRIWNVVRSQEQIQAAMNTPLTGNEEGLLAYWNFDDGTAKDLSGHSNDGLLNGDAQIVESPRPVSIAAQEGQPNMLVAWWRLDEADGNDVADSSGNGRAGRLVGNPRWQPAGGKVGGALAFDGEGDFLEIGDEPAFDLAGPITIAAWIKVNAFDKKWQTIIAKGDTSWRLQRTSEENTLAFHCTGIVSVEGQWSEGIEGKKSVNDGQWHHVVGVYDGAEVSLYIDGVLDKSSEAYGSIQANDFAVTIGGNSEKEGREWNGLVDELCVIAGAIDANGIHALYTGADPITVAKTAHPQLQGPDKLLAWWKFDNDANDSAGANHGTIHGNPTYADGKVGRAINLDGDDYVDCGNPDSLNFGTGDWTISAWIKTTQSGTNEDDAHKNKGTIFANGGDEEGGVRYSLVVNEAILDRNTLTTDDDNAKVQVTTRTVVNDGTWHHVVGMRKAGQLHVYVDGVLDGGDYLPEGYDLSGASQHNAYIGVITDHRDGSLYKYFTGLIDEVCIIRGAIDANGVRALFSGEDPVTVAKSAVIARPARAAAAERVDAAPSEAAPVVQEQFQDQTSGSSNIAIVLILVLALASVVAGIVFFLVKSSIKK